MATVADSSRAWPTRRGASTPKSWSRACRRVIKAVVAGRAPDAWSTGRPSTRDRQRRRDAVMDAAEAGTAWHQAMVDAPAACAAPRRVGVAHRRCSVRASSRQAVAGRRRHHRARDRHLAPGAGDDGPGALGVHRPARAHGAARAARRARRPGPAARARAGAHRRSRPGADAGLDATAWRDLQPVLHEEFGVLVQEAYHETNRWLVAAARAARGRPAAA